MSKRAEAVKWWESLKLNEQQAMILKHFPRMEFMIVSMESDKIIKMFNYENLNKKEV